MDNGLTDVISFYWAFPTHQSAQMILKAGIELVGIPALELVLKRLIFVILKCTLVLAPWVLP